MAVKVEMAKNEKKGVLAIAFESSNDNELDVIDMVRFAVMADVDKQCGYVNSRRMVVHIPLSQLPESVMNAPSQ